jgi:hypothetical protein
MTARFGTVFVEPRRVPIMSRGWGCFLRACTTAHLVGELIAINCLPAAVAEADLFHGLNAGAPVWAGNVVLTPQKAQQLAATGTRSIRMNFRLDSGATTWTGTQLARYDQVIANARNAGLEILGLFSSETVAGGQAAWNDDPDNDGLNSYVSQFASTAQFLVNRYRDDIRKWELWNEPDAWTNPNYANDPKNAGGSYMLPRVYARLLSETYRSLDSASLLGPQGARLMSGGLFAHDIGGSFTTAMGYMQQVYNQNDIWNAMQADFARRYPWDEFGYHFYISQGSLVSTSQLASYFNAVRSGQAMNSDPANMAVTEFSWQTAGGNTQELQRDNMATAYDFLEARSYIAGTYWYQWTDDVTGAWGLVNGAGQPKLSYYEFVARNLVPLPGDYNNDDKVDAADYVVWRKNEGTMNSLPNDQIGGTIDADQYNQWRAHFGETAPAATRSSSTVPEPAAVGLLLTAIFACIVAVEPVRSRTCAAKRSITAALPRLIARREIELPVPCRVR